MPITILKVMLSSDDPLLLAAASMEPKIRNAYLAAIEAVKSQIALNKLSAALESGDVNQVMAILALDERLTGALQGKGLEANIQSVRDAIQMAYAAGAKVAMMRLPAKVSVNLSFDLLNPESVNFLQSYTFNLIQQVTQSQREAVQQVILRAFREGGHPYEQAREIKGIIGLTARMEQAVTNYRKALESGGSALRNALSRSLRDGRFDPTLLRALNTGQSLDKNYIDKLVQRYRERYLQYRARNIARTESIRAANKGQRELWRQARQQGLLPHTARRRWIASMDDRTCSECAGLDEETAGMDEEFAPGIMEPPDPHPSCRCTTAIDADSLKEVAA
jgi:SPP1 gp7 family putative phage head morphogenesis protein